MSRRTISRGDLYVGGVVPRLAPRMIEERRPRDVRTRAKPRRLRAALLLVATILAGLVLGLGIAGFQHAPAWIRMVAFDLTGFGAARTCEEARELGFGAVQKGQRGYFAHLDLNKDGVSCDYVSGRGYM
jgi:hypothetical protein